MDPITQQILEQQRAIQARPNFTGYQPSFSSLDDGIATLQPPTVNQSLDMSAMGTEENQLMNQTGIGALGFQPTEDVMDPVQIAKNIAVNTAIDYGVKKFGLPKAAGKILGSAINPSLALGFVPLQGIAALGSNLFGRAGNIAAALQAKRTQKAIERDIQRDTQGAVSTPMSPKIANIQPSGRDIARGEISTTTTSKGSPSRSARHTAGPGGLHSGY